MSTDSDNVHYEATTPGFSYFKIAAGTPHVIVDVHEEDVTEEVITQQEDIIIVDTPIAEQENMPAEVTTIEKQPQKNKWILSLIIFGLIFGVIYIVVSVRGGGKKGSDKTDEPLHIHNPSKTHQQDHPHKVHHHTHHEHNRIHSEKAEEKIAEFFKKHHDRGESDEDIIEKLEKVGWDKKYIEKINNKQDYNKHH